MFRSRATVILAVAVVVAALPARAAPSTVPHVQAPLALSLDVTTRGDIVEVTATVSARGRLAADPVLRMLLPEGATLLEGAAEEVLIVSGDGVDVVRRFAVSGLGSGRLRLTADAVSDASGAHAEASWPPLEPDRLGVAPHTESIPPVTVGGVRIDHAIPLAPAKRQVP